MKARWLLLFGFVIGWLTSDFSRYFLRRVYSWGYTAVFIAAIVVLAVVLFREKARSGKD